MGIAFHTKNLKNAFNLRSMGTKALTLTIEHAPCCILSFAAGFVGLPLLNHNPTIELGFALGGAVIGEHIGHKLFSKNHSHGHGWGSKIKRYGLALSFGVASWGVHQTFFHDHQNHDNTHSHEIHDCNHPITDETRPSFASPALQRQMNEAHKQLHQQHCK